MQKIKVGLSKSIQTLIDNSVRVKMQEYEQYIKDHGICPKCKELGMDDYDSVMHLKLQEIHWEDGGSFYSDAMFQCELHPEVFFRSDYLDEMNNVNRNFNYQLNEANIGKARKTN